ncbi:FAD-binding protein [Kallotenue papyrolyticum]|uniref:FAD-binding protein n=1 Tax=Kallotenue papyrolyticum TaxID=1325125 RepID=UPI000492C0F8|nr:FAD-binding protein [Kallotenue papyrolyticum]
MIRHDVLIVGCGVAGMRAAIELRRRAPQADIAIVSKLYPVRAPSVAVHDGLAAALGYARSNAAGQPVPDMGAAPADTWQTHLADMLRTAAGLADPGLAELICRAAPAAVFELEHWGMPFARWPDGRLAQRAAPGHTQPRLAYADEQTGQQVVQTLYGELLRHRVRVYPEWFVLSLALTDGVCHGMVALDLQSGQLAAMQARVTLLATGGYGTLFQLTSQGSRATGDGLAAAYRAGLPLQDLEFVQWHALGLYGHGATLGDEPLAAGGSLLNGLGERFLQHYTPAQERAPQPVILRAVAAEIEAGRGAGAAADGVLLDLRHLDEAALRQLPRVLELARDLHGLDPRDEPLPVQPTAEFTLGGLPTDADGRVLDVQTGGERAITGLFAAGACAAGLHGALCLPGHGLLAALVSGQRAGAAIAAWLQVQACQGSALPPLPATALEQARAEVEALLASRGSERVAAIRRDLRVSMQQHVGPVRHAQGLTRQLGVLNELRERFSRVGLDDRSRRCNTELLEALELARLLDLSHAVVLAALERGESRGAHQRLDAPQTDEGWLGHTLVRTDAMGQPTVAMREAAPGSSAHVRSEP